MGLELYTWSWQGDSGLPEDRFENTFHIERDAGASPDDIVDTIRDEFWLSVTGGSTLTGYMSKALNGEYQVKGYLLSDPEPRVPFIIRDGSTAVGSTALPSEVALCASYHADLTSGVDAARRKGRIYVGPLSTVGLDTNVGRPTSGLLEAVRFASANLYAALLAIASPWTVYSRADSASYPIVGGWVDNSFDTQRRRGEGPTLRVTWPA